MSKISIFSHTKKTFSEEVALRLGKGSIHAARLYSDWFRKGDLGEFSQWAEPQSFQLVQKIIEESDFSLPEMSRVLEEGKTFKFLLKFQDQLESESVLIPMESGTTLCLSSQVGCRMGCAFCETGRMGLLRSLECHEIVAQVFSARFVLKQQVRNLVFMGMGEPFDNYQEVRRAIAVLTDPGGLGFGPSRVTISTSGHVEGIYRMIEEMHPAVNLAVSVNAPNDLTRRALMPVNRRWDMGALKQAMVEYCKDERREILAEYVLIQGVNDSLSAADALADYLTGLRVKVNLIPYNPQKGDRFFSPLEEEKEAFLQRMRARGYQTLLRGTKGQGIQAACGQLGNIEIRQKKSKIGRT